MTAAYINNGDVITLHRDITHIVSRSINLPPLLSQDNEQRPSPYPINEVQDLRVREALILQDLFGVFIGLEGSYIRYSKKFDPNSESIAGPNYNITRHLDLSLVEVAKRLAKLGTFYYGLTSFVQRYDDDQNGKITQALCFEIRRLLQEYWSILINAELRFSSDDSFSLRLLEQHLNESISFKLAHCYELVIFIYRENQERSQHMENRFQSLILDIKNDLQQTGTIDLHSHAGNSKIMKGGLILKIIEKRLEIVKGDPVSFQFLTQLFDNVSKEYINILNSWLLRGEINDPHDEFIIKLSDDVSGSVYTESYWDKKFTLRKEGLVKQFLNRDIQYKILLTGKYLNIMKECGINVDDVPTSSIEIKSLNNRDLYLQIDNAFKRSNQLITDFYFNGLNITWVLKSLNRFYFLNNNHNFNNFLNLSINELKKNQTLVSEATLLRHFYSAFALESDNSSVTDELRTRKLIFDLLNLKLEPNNVYDYLLEILSVQPIDTDEALSSSNMNFLKNLLNRTLEAERNDRPSSSTHTKTDNYAINRLNFKLLLPFPLNLIITDSFLIQYELIMRHHMIIKFIDKLLENSWKEINYQKFWRYTYRNNKINKWILRARILHSKMKTLMNILQFYLSNDVIDKNWQIFEKFLDNDCDLNNLEFQFETVYTNLQSFINVVFTNSFLTMDRMINLINKLFSIITLFSNFVNSLRKTLVLLDEDLFNEYESKLTNKTFDVLKNDERFIKLNNVLENYNQNFDEVLKEFGRKLQYHGETECFAFVLLFERLSLSKLI